MSLLVLSIIALVTGAVLAWLHILNVKQCHGNEGGMISFVFLFVWGIAQVLVGAAAAIVWFWSRSVSDAGWWTFVVLYALAWSGPAYLFVEQLRYNLRGWNPFRIR